MIFLRWIRDGYVAFGFLFVLLLSVYMSASLYTNWRVDWISGHFNLIGLLVVLDGFFLFWQAIEQQQKRLLMWLGMALGCLSLLVLLSIIAKGSIAVFFTGLYAISFSILMIVIIVFGSIELSDRQKKESEQ